MWTAEQIGPAVKEVRVFDMQDHPYFTYSLDIVLMQSLLFTLEKDERPYEYGVHEHWQALETNHEIGFAPVFKENKITPLAEQKSL
jgi:hypothetical protein